jgi:16S rRNA processing protein RimM
MDRGRVVLAEILRPRGNRGELLAISQTDVPGRLENLTLAQARLSDSGDVTVEITEAWQYREHWVFKFRGVDSISDAERFRGADLWVPLAERATLPEGEYFRTDLIGCSVVDGGTGAVLGSVEGWQQYGGPPLLELTAAGREVLIPFVGSICRKVDLEQRTITVDLPEGLLELQT